MHFFLLQQLMQKNKALKKGQFNFVKLHSKELIFSTKKRKFQTLNFVFEPSL